MAHPLAAARAAAERVANRTAAGRAASHTVGHVAGRATSSAVVGAYKLGEVLAQAAPKQVGEPVLAAVGQLASLRGGDRRTIVERNLRRVYGRDLTRNEVSSKVQATFESYARYYYDSFRLTGM